MDSTSSHMQELETAIAEGNGRLADLEALMKEATETRQIGKKENAAAIKDAQTAQTALANAIAVLTDFYKDSGMVAKEDWEFVQRQKDVVLPENPATWDSSYTG